MREEAQRNGSLERRDRALGLLHHRLFSHITMNWRGRPLTSHEVMLQTIAAPPAAPASSSMPNSTAASTRHRFHGDWNYTLDPQRPMDAATAGSASDEALADRPTRLTRSSLQAPELTGMTRQQLIDSLTPAMEVQREQVLRARRGHERLVAPGSGAKAKLTSADRVLVTVLHLRKNSRPWTSWARSSTPPP
ncbi:hypothetical protein ACFYR1_53290 [Streptomyces canus]|uniref:ISAzo13-like element transposase-related protein n=1 Tax=Streptomyces canus TaxID=58343 RepID=UPI0036A1A76F